MLTYLITLAENLEAKYGRELTDDELYIIQKTWNAAIEHCKGGN